MVEIGNLSLILEVYDTTREDSSGNVNGYEFNEVLGNGDMFKGKVQVKIIVIIYKSCLSSDEAFENNNIPLVTWVTN